MKDWTHLPWKRPFSSTTNIPTSPVRLICSNMQSTILEVTIRTSKLQCRFRAAQRLQGTTLDSPLAERLRRASQATRDLRQASQLENCLRRWTRSMCIVTYGLIECWSDADTERDNCCNMSPGLGSTSGVPPPQANRVAQCHKHLDE